MIQAAEAADAADEEVTGKPIAHPATNGTTPFRALPHSLEAEELLLGSIFCDPDDVLDRCTKARLTPSHFYFPNHSIVYECLLKMRANQQVINSSTIALELTTARLLDQVGGIGFIAIIDSKVPTPATAPQFIRTVVEQHTIREIIRAATASVEDCYNYSGDLDVLTSDVRRRLETAVTVAKVSKSQVMDWDELLAFDPKHDPDCLMGNRFLGRTGGLVIVAPSGVGKSVLALQLGACAALTRPFFTMIMRQPMRVLYLQAEDDFGDVAESAQGFFKGNELSAADLATLKDRLRIERWNDCTGFDFLARLKKRHDTYPYDLVIINPLFSFCGCNVSEQSELSPFLRNGLNGVLNEVRAAAVLVHHTNKPPADPSHQEQAMNSELRYLGSGSAELTNWARAYITLQGVRSAGDGVHKMVFVKRGTRTGILDDDGKPTTSVYVEHSKTGLCWLPSDFRPDSSAGGKFQNRFDLARALTVYDSKKHWTENEILIARDQQMSPRAIRTHRRQIEEAG